MSQRSSLEEKLTFLITFFLVFELLSHNAPNKLKKTSNKQKAKIFFNRNLLTARLHSYYNTWSYKKKKHKKVKEYRKSV